jgi:hypothetical protein
LEEQKELSKKKERKKESFVIIWNDDDFTFRALGDMHVMVLVTMVHSLQASLNVRFTMKDE